MKSKALKYSIYFSIIGLFITVLVAYVERNTIDTYQQNLPYLKLGDNIKNRVTKAHLWFEELLGGDASLNFERDVLQPIQGAQAILQGAFDGKETELGTFEAFSDEESKALLKEAIIAIDKLAIQAQERWKNKPVPVVVTDSTGAVISSTEPQIAGGGDDQKFDAAYEAFQLSMDRFMERMNGDVAADVSDINLLSWVSIFLVVVIFVGLGFVLFRLQQGNDKITEESRQLLESQGKAVTSLTSFVEAISSGNYNVELNMEGDSNLSQTLLTMRDKLRANAEDDRRRNWSTTGLAQIGEILRASSSTSSELFDSIIKFVVKYTKSNQGGLFVLNEDNESDKYLELVACYAFERKKFLKKNVQIGEGLIGQSYLEGQRIYLLEVPQEYITITSGLGGSNPNALLIVPLKVNDRIYGVIELATFGKYQDYEIELVEKLAESIGSTISTVRVNESTRLLLERTQQQAEEMRSQEEEMRQNMEELEATQEEMRRKEKHIQEMLDGEKKRNEISQKNRKVVMELTKNRDIQTGNWSAALEKITSAICNQIHVSRCSVWLLNDMKNKITSAKLYQADAKSFESGTELFARDFPGYFEAVTREEVIVATDAFTHSATREFGDLYLKPLNIFSLLDVPFFNEGRIAGVLCCEQQHNQKDWSEEDIEFLKSCSDLITVCYNTMKINSMVDNLNAAQETLQTIIDNVPRAIFWKDKDLKFQGCNKIFAQVAGLKSPKDLIGYTDFDMPWKEHAKAYREDDMTVMKTRTSRLDLEERNVNSQGEESWVMTSKVPVINSNGEVVAVLGMFEDITERKRKEADINAKLQELETLRKLLESRAN